MDVDEVLTRGATLIQLGKIEQAQSLVREALAVEPDEPFLLLLLHGCYEGQGLWEKAEEAALACVSADPECSYAYEALARSMIFLNKNEEALEAILTAIELEPEGDSELYGIAARILTKLRRYDEGLEQANKGLSLYSECLGCQFEKAILLLLLRRYGEARHCLQEILVQSPENSYARVFMSEIDCKFGQLENAKEHLEGALEFDPENRLAGKCLHVLTKLRGKEAGPINLISHDQLFRRSPSV